MIDKQRLDPEVLYRELRRCLRHGARASRLARFAPEFVEMLVPAWLHPATSLTDRAIYTENLIRDAVRQIGGARGEALDIVLCFAPGTLGTTLEERRRRAAALLDILPDTFRRERYEGLMLWDLAWEVLGRVPQ